MLGLFSLLGVACAASLEEARADIVKTYNFDPSSMSFDKQSARAPELSKLWDRYSKAQETYAPALRTELRTVGNTELLYCDGGMLLLAKARDNEDEILGLASIRQCSLVEIQHTPFFYTLHALAVKGIDTFDLQTRMLSKPKYSVFIVQHALILGQDYAFLYPFLVQDESKYVPRLIARLQVENDEVAQKSLIRALWYAASPESFSALKVFLTLPNVKPSVKAEASNLLEQYKKIQGLKESDPILKRIYSELSGSQNLSLEELKSKRRMRMRSISDEALYDLEAYTVLLYRAQKSK